MERPLRLSHKSRAPSFGRIEVKRGSRKQKKKQKQKKVTNAMYKAPMQAPCSRAMFFSITGGGCGHLHARQRLHRRGPGVRRLPRRLPRPQCRLMPRPAKALVRRAQTAVLEDSSAGGGGRPRATDGAGQPAAAPAAKRKGTSTVLHCRPRRSHHITCSPLIAR